ncbi:hypothetical protein G6M87_10885 [Rhizobium rhizogenes]|uniref:hypothetical protein n=1 Tax=Rhizobium rhizogenes TaxID=359 RepID=UPI00157443E1|nr:hypothetical protein [Rhizobium rhizogenes]NTI22362.1 hypothetical protein [Rhizobium rhizogenes]QTG05949.1 hypothetical protein G6M87_10885 [Rhizobium rhizogenes]
MNSNTQKYDPAEDVYIRPQDRRFNPTDWEKSLIKAPWVNCDPVAMSAVEERYTITEQVTVDNHGYPTS